MKIYRPEQSNAWKLQQQADGGGGTKSIPESLGNDNGQLHIPAIANQTVEDAPVSKTLVKRAKSSDNGRVPELVLVSTPRTVNGRLAKVQDMGSSYYFDDSLGRGQVVYALEFGYTPNNVRKCTILFCERALLTGK